MTIEDYSELSKKENKTVIIVVDGDKVCHATADMEDLKELCFGGIVISEILDEMDKLK